MWIARTLDDIGRHRRSMSGKVGLVPTMGALHEGHMSLVAAARKRCDGAVMSIFVNPMQFGPGEDFERYPRPVERDLEMCRQAGVAGVFLPDPVDMYPPGRPPCDITIPSMAAILEGAVRPTHFAGVCRVVAKLFHLVQPDQAFFGLKDYQQLRIIEAMVADLDFPVQIVPMPTLRESDGLAMSSRNAYLSASARTQAVGLFKALSQAQLLVEDEGETDPGTVEAAMKQVLVAHHIDPDYALIRHPHTLTPMDSINPTSSGGVVALLAGRLAGVRLIDNMLMAYAPLPDQRA